MINAITSPLFVIVFFLIAILTSRLVINVAGLSNDIDDREKGRYKSIDGLRGGLAISVFIHHVLVTWFYVHTGEWKQLDSNFYNQLGEASVALFFMITAFLFFGRVLDQGRSFNWKHFFISRLLRIYPLYILVLLIVYSTVLFASGFHLNVPLQSLIYQLAVWARFGSIDINLVTDSILITARAQWSILYEMKFYVCILPLLWLILVSCGRVVLVLTILLYFSYLVFGTYPLPYIGDIKNLCFFGGIFAAFYVRKYPLRAYPAWYSSWLVCLILGVTMIFYKSAYSLVPISLLTIFFTIIATGNSLFGTLLRPSILWLGEVSYSIYLLHGIVVYFVLNKLFSFLVLSFSLSLPTQLVLFVGMTGLCIVSVIFLASVSFWFVERYGIALSKRILFK